MSIIEKAVEKAGKEGKRQHKTDQLTEKEQDLDEVSASKGKNNVAVQQQIAQEVTTEGKLENEQTKKAKFVTIDVKALFKKGFLVTDNASPQMVEEFRVIKRPLVKNALGGSDNGIKRSNLILITSSIASEGKTYTAINLALSIANELDRKVLLVDADVAKPSVSKVLGIQDQGSGLLEYLEDESVDFSEIIFETNIPGLRLIQAGKKHYLSTELLASNRMAQLAGELSSRYPDRIVIFDSPPLLAATQAEVLATLVGQVVLVVEAEKTSQNMVTDALDKLDMCDVVFGLLNKYSRSFDYDYYGYGQYG